MSKYDLDPSLTDEELKRKFSPLQRQFYEWEENGGNILDVPIGQTKSFLENRFRGGKDVWEQWRGYRKGWGGRLRWRLAQPLSRGAVNDLIERTQCNDSVRLSTTITTIRLRNIPDLLLGQSRFGDTWTGYAVALNPYCLQPDGLVRDQQENPARGTPVDSSVLCIKTGASVQPRRALEPLEQNSNRGQRSANSAAKEMCFFQLGELRACSGKEWHQARQRPECELGNADWKPTGFCVVVELDRNSRPNGGVYVLYNPNKETSEHGVSEDLPPVGLLYPSCKHKFMFAKISIPHRDVKLGELKGGETFTFDVKSRDTFQLSATRLARGGSKVIVPVN